MKALFSVEKTDNEQVFGLAYDWYLKSVDILKIFANNCFSDRDKDEFISSLKAGMNYLGTIRGVPSILVHAEVHNDRTMEGHIFVAGKVNQSSVASVIELAKEDIFETSSCEVIIVNVLARHSRLIKAVKNSGFSDTGLRSVAGIYRSKFLESLFFTVKKS